MKDVANYFTILQSWYSFFGHSINRWDIVVTTIITGESDITFKEAQSDKVNIKT